MSSITSNDASYYLDMDNEDLVVENLLNKYNIQTNTNKSFMYNINDDYNALIEYISKLFLDEKDIPLDIKDEINNNIHFKAYLTNHIQNRLEEILNNSSIVFFKEIVILLNLLSFGKDYKLFKSYNVFDLDNLASLFRKYEDTIQKQKENHFETSFLQYQLLLECLNKICTLNSNDIYRKKDIKDIIDLITETINITKFKIKLENSKINILNNILGNFLFMYSHVPYIEIENKDYKYLIKEFYFNFKKIYDGYEVLNSTLYSEDEKKEENYLILLNSISILLSNLTYKLKDNYNLKDTNIITELKDILSFYEKIITHKKKEEINSIEEFSNNLLENFSYIYNLKTNNNLNYLEIVEEFLKKKEFNINNMQIILLIILYSEKIKDDKLIETLEILIQKDKFENDYYEYYKLSLCDIIILKLTKTKNETIKNFLHSKVTSYIEKNKKASHLMANYFKLYLSLSVYYSYYNDEKSLQITKEFFYKYININGKLQLKSHYNQLNDIVLLNLGKNHAKDLEIFETINSSSKFKDIGNKLIEKYSNDFEINLKYNVNQKLTNIVSEIFTKEGLSNDSLDKNIEEFISNEIFHGLIFCAVEGLCEEKCKLVDLGYKKTELHLFEGYKLRIAYSSVYEDIFQEIYKKNKSYIQQNLKNIIISYIKSIPIYIDSVTKTFNKNKLIEDLEKKENETIVFIEIFFENLEQINKKYDYENGNEIFKHFALQINELAVTYRIYGPSLGIITNEKEYSNIIEKIKKVEINYKNIIIKPKLKISATWGENYNILEKAEYGIALAKNSKSGFYEFK
ncbi:hypothetical protein [Arcobacter sp. YIC-310]|uniref:hypothetical protein n=1 Tax=Arcobacter sp. YIC-310 TaxID=3376632 RepID=UPI003C151DB2